MSRPKTLIKHSKSNKKKSKEPTLETADDYLAFGVEHEESGGKWRAGDATKSLRFFGRAVETYDAGLAKWPGNVDLAYNKARVQLEVATSPLLVRYLEKGEGGKGAVVRALEEARASHEYVLGLKGGGDNADALFNAAQVLMGIAEAVMDSNGEEVVDGYSEARVLRLLEEALELLSRCLDIQEIRYEEAEAQKQEMMADTDAMQGDEEMENDDGGVRLDETSNSADSAIDRAENQWFSILEPVTKETLLDTLLSQLSTLTTLCSVLSSINHNTTPSISWIENFSQPIVTSKIPSVTSSDTDNEKQAEINLTTAKFKTALLELAFRQTLIDLPTYKSERDKAFAIPGITSSPPSYDAILSNAESLISFESALSDTIPTAELAPARWGALTTAITSLATAAKIPSLSSDDIAKTHFLRGDASLLQHALSLPPISFPHAVGNKEQLLKNAETYYRNAGRLYGDGEEEGKAVAGVREEIVGVLRGGDGNGNGSRDRLRRNGMGGEWVRRQVGFMEAEGLIAEGFLL